MCSFHFSLHAYLHSKCILPEFLWTLYISIFIYLYMYIYQVTLKVMQIYNDFVNLILLLFMMFKHCFSQTMISLSVFFPQFFFLRVSFKCRHYVLSYNYYDFHSETICQNFFLSHLSLKFFFFIKFNLPFFFPSIFFFFS